MEEADAACFFYMDDGYQLGPVQVVTRVARELKVRLEAKGIHSHPEKNLAFTPSADGRLTQYLAEHQDAGFQQGVDASGDLFGVKVAGLPVLAGRGRRVRGSAFAGQDGHGVRSDRNDY